MLDPLAAVAPGAPLVHREAAASAQDAVSIDVRPIAGTNVCHRFRIRHGDVARGLAEADVVVEEVFRTAAAAHAPMEPHAALAEWEDGRLTVWSGTQTPFNTRADLAGLLGLAEGDPRDRAADGRIVRGQDVRAAGGAGRRARAQGAAAGEGGARPRRGVRDGQPPPGRRARADRRAPRRHAGGQGGDCWADTGAYADCGPGVATKMGYAGVGPYRIPHVRVDSLAIYTNLPPGGAFRGYGATQSVWASERTMDLLAGELEMSPLELRRRNLLRDGDTFATGEVMRDVHFEECLQAAADAVGYEADPRGKGLCVLLKGMQTPSRAEVAVERTPVGYVVRSASCEMGQDVRQTLRLMAARLLGCEPGQVEVPDPDTSTSPFDTRTTSSRSTYMMGRALAEAVRDMGDGDRGFGEVRNEGGLDPDTGQGVASTHWHQGAAAAHVSLDAETGRLTVEHLHASVYAGRVVNRPGAELQNEGSMLMGLGTALFEGIDFADGQATNANLSDYNVPAAGDLPRLTHDLIESGGAEAHGLGETALPPVPPAIGNALASLGAHVTELPMTAERVLEALWTSS